MCFCKRKANHLPEDLFWVSSAWSFSGSHVWIPVCGFVFFRLWVSRGWSLLGSCCRIICTWRISLDRWLRSLSSQAAVCSASASLRWLKSCRCKLTAGCRQVGSRFSVWPQKRKFFIHPELIPSWMEKDQSSALLKRFDWTLRNIELLGSVGFFGIQTVFWRFSLTDPHVVCFKQVSLDFTLKEFEGKAAAKPKMFCIVMLLRFSFLFIQLASFSWRAWMHTFTARRSQNTFTMIQAQKFD